MSDVSCPSCGIPHNVPDDPELEETRAELRRLQLHGSAPPGFALVSREMLRTLLSEASVDQDAADMLIDKALGEGAFGDPG